VTCNPELIPDKFGKPIMLLHVHYSSLKTYPKRPPARTYPPTTFIAPPSLIIRVSAEHL
jgi:hypothetical protein